MPIKAPYVIVFGRFDIILKNSRISFYLFICFLLNFIILRSRAISVWYQSMTSIRDQVIILVLHQLYRKMSQYMRHVSVISGHPISTGFLGLTSCQRNPWDRGVT